MNTLVSRVIIAVLQILLFSLIPFIWWFVTARKKISFLQWMGLKWIPETKKRYLVWSIFGIEIIFLLANFWFSNLLKGVPTAYSAFRGAGFQALPAIIVYALFQTSFPEELLFRGFLLKRVKNRCGFALANAFQATLFGLLHGALFYSYVGLFKTILIILLTGGIGWVMGYINEQKADGSILLGWAIHAMANLVSGLTAAFLL